MLRMFKKGNKIAYKRIFSEEKSAITSELSSWITKFELICADYDKAVIFNFDETAIFVKQPSNFSYVAASDSRKGAKVDETRLTLGLCYNCYGLQNRTYVDW